MTAGSVFPAGSRPNPLDGPDAEGPAAPPRANGELVFTAPWQSRLFATTMRLWEQERFEWDTFRSRLIDEIAAHETELGYGRDETTGGPAAPDGPAPVADDPRYDYWGCWLRALEGVLSQLDLVSTPKLDTRGEVIAARPPDH